MISLSVLLVSFRIFLYFLADGVNASTQACYDYDGSEDVYPKKCPNSSMCCYLDRTDGYDDDECLQSVCRSNAGDMKGEYFVVACIYPEHDSRECSAAWKACGNNDNGYTKLTSCDNGSWCCGKGNSTCCDDGEGFFLSDDGTEIQYQPSTATSTLNEDQTTSTDSVPVFTRSAGVSPSPPASALSAAPTTTTPATNTTGSKAGKKSSGLSTSDKIALGVGIPCALAAVLGIWKKVKARNDR